MQWRIYNSALGEGAVESASYKRKIKLRLININTFKAVSYTHLDVYKRQLP